MASIKAIIFATLITLSTMLNATHKVYVIHGYGGFGLQMEKIHKSLEKAGYRSENFTYHSFSEDVDAVAQKLFEAIISENVDTISFVTHSMGALVVRSMIQNFNKTTKSPYIHRFVMIAPPNKGTPVADFYNTFGFIKMLGGPNIQNLTTDPQVGASRFPIPTCEVGLILGITGKKKGYNFLLDGDNDGYVLPDKAKLGIEKDIAYVKANHSALTQNKKVIKLTLSFLKNGSFEKEK